MDEFVKVTYPTRRTVRLNGVDAGYTNEVFQVQSGHQTFDLGDPQDYTPAEHTVRVLGTAADRPMIIAFSPKGG